MLSPVKAAFVDKRGPKLFVSSKREERDLEVFYARFILEPGRGVQAGQNGNDSGREQRRHHGRRGDRRSRGLHNGNPSKAFESAPQPSLPGGFLVYRVGAQTIAQSKCCRYWLNIGRPTGNLPLFEGFGWNGPSAIPAKIGGYPGNSVHVRRYSTRHSMQGKWKCSSKPGCHQSCRYYCCVLPWPSTQGKTGSTR